MAFSIDNTVLSFAIRDFTLEAAYAQPYATLQKRRASVASHSCIFTVQLLRPLNRFKNPRRTTDG